MGGPEAAKLTPQIGFKMTANGISKFIADNSYKTLHKGVKSSAGDSISERLVIEAATGMRKALNLNQVNLQPMVS